jgi:hypothetical protein
VGGGGYNTAGGYAGTVGGGLENSAAGHYSFAAGYRAKANHEGTFVWNDRSIVGGNDSLVSTGDNQFLIRAAGGVGIGTNSPLSPLHVETEEQGLPGAATTNEDITVESSDAIIGLYSDNNGLFGSGLVLGEITGAALSDKWGLVRTTGPSSKLYITYSVDSSYVGNAGIPFTVASSGEVGIQRTSPLHPLHVGTDGTNGNGAHVTVGGTWTDGSSRTFKEDLRRVKPSDVLEAVSKMPIYRWRYKLSDEGDHMGPVAEDFYDSFELGNDERYIAGVDGDGVALAAIQGLYELVKEQQAEIERMREVMELLIPGPEWAKHPRKHDR